jgi:hypothetical protein
MVPHERAIQPPSTSKTWLVTQWAATAIRLPPTGTGNSQESAWLR